MCFIAGFESAWGALKIWYIYRKMLSIGNKVFVVIGSVDIGTVYKYYILGLSR